jgi:hypothetical protein
MLTTLRILLQGSIIGICVSLLPPIARMACNGDRFALYLDSMQLYLQNVVLINCRSMAFHYV